MPHWQGELAGEELSFGSFRLIAKQRQLLRGDRPVSIGQRALDVLITLAGRPGETVSQQELMAQAWRGTHVDDSNLRMQISAVRKALGDGVDGVR
jgi:DNA-binding winged helix-turn-helix (wHTH) protein